MRTCRRIGLAITAALTLAGGPGQGGAAAEVVVRRPVTSSSSSMTCRPGDSPSAS